MPAPADDGTKLVVRNRKAHHEFQIEDTLEAGMVLTGPEIKSIRAGQVTLTGGFVMISDGEAWLHEVYIAPYEQGSYANLEPRRVRKLLLNRREIARLALRTRDAGWTLVPLSIYLRRGKAKLEVGVARGKRSYDKREAIREREDKIDRARAIGRRDGA